MRLLDKVLGAPWAVLPTMLETILDVVRRESVIPRADWPRYRALERAASEGYRLAAIENGVALLPIAGVIIPKYDAMQEVSGATALEAAGADLARALADPDVAAIVLDIDSPGGSVFGVGAFAEQVRAAGKPVVAFTDGMMASAAFWIGAAARELVAEKSAMVGSVGVVGAVALQVAPQVLSGRQTFEVVSSGAPMKRLDPRVEEQAAAIRAGLDDYEAQFVGALAGFRGLDAKTVLAKFGRGATMIAERALAAGMIDRLGSLKDAIARARALAALPVSPAAQHRAADAGVPSAGPPTQEETMSNKTEQGGPHSAATPSTPPAPPLDANAVRTEAVAAERARIQAIRAAALPGQETLVEEHIAAGSTAEQFAVAALAHEKARGAKYIEARRQGEDALARVAPSGAPTPATAPANSSEAAAGVPADDVAAKAAYAKDPKLRQEFETEAEFVAYCAAVREGKVKVFAPRRSAA